MKAGHYENDKGAVEKMIKESPQIIQDLKDFGVRFDLKDGEIEFTREGGHSTFRILHHEDLTGKEITSHLYEEAKKRDNITIMENCTMIDIIEKDGECKGIVYKDADGNLDTIEAPDTVLATGGLGGLFKHSTNFRHLTADSLAICLRHNVELENINYIQIHPTTFYSKKPGRRFLISESVRGEGAYLLNKDGERFTDELKPRDVVTGEICKQMKKDGSDHVYLSVTHLDGERIKHRFPNIYKQCLDEGYDMTKEPIPIYPCQHYLMGGIQVDTNSETTVPNLYAAGECSNTGVHGNNRLASNSLLEALVFSRRAALDIATKLPTVPDAFAEATFPETANTLPMPKGTRTEIRQIMQNSYFVIPHQAELLNGFERIKEIRRELYSEPYAVTPDLIEAKAMATNAYTILKEVL